MLIDRHFVERKDISDAGGPRLDGSAEIADEAAKVRAANRSYLFFRITDLTNEGEPLGAQGVRAERRAAPIAVDQRARDTRTPC